MKIERESPAFMDNKKNASSKEQDCEIFDLDCKTSTMIHKYKDQLYYTAGCNTCAVTCATCP